MSTKNTLKDRRHQYLNVSYAGTHLKYPLSHYGIWEVLGEDSNCDLGGPHYMPKLGVYEGTLGEVVDIAVMLPNFWTWGGGGEIRLITVKSVKDAAKDVELMKEKAELEARLAEINKILGK